MQPIFHYVQHFSIIVLVISSCTPFDRLLYVSLYHIIPINAIAVANRRVWRNDELHTLDSSSTTCIFFKLVICFLQKGESGIHVASGSGHVDVLNYLHMKGADLSLVDVNGDTAMHWAARGGHANIVSYLAIEQLNVNEQNKVDRFLNFLLLFFYFVSMITFLYFCFISAKKSNKSINCQINRNYILFIEGANASSRGCSLRSSRRHPCTARKSSSRRHSW